MIDRETVIDGLKKSLVKTANCRNCPYYETEYCRFELLNDAIKLLHGFEPQGAKPLTYFHGINNPFTHRCGHCMHSVEGGQHFCGGCGWKILWE